MGKYTFCICDGHTLRKYLMILSNISEMLQIMEQVLEQQSSMMTAIAKLQSTVKPTASPDDDVYEPRVCGTVEEFDAFCTRLQREKAFRDGYVS